MSLTGHRNGGECRIAGPPGGRKVRNHALATITLKRTSLSEHHSFNAPCHLQGRKPLVNRNERRSRHRREAASERGLCCASGAAASTGAAKAGVCPEPVGTAMGGEKDPPKSANSRCT